MIDKAEGETEQASGLLSCGIVWGKANTKAD